MEAMKLNLQLFAEDPAGAEPAQGGEGSTPPEPQQQAGPQEEKKYSDKDVAAMQAKWKAEQEKAAESAREEAEKLAKMNTEQKRQFELEQLQKENARLRADAARVELGRTATAILKEHKIDATQDILDFVVGTDAQDTKGRIDRFVAVVEAQVKAAEVRRATGRTPKDYGGGSSGGVLSEIDRRIAKYN